METAASADAAARMERYYRWQRNIYDASRKYYLWGRDRLIAELELAPNETLLEIGCGTARNLIAVGRRYPGAQLFGFDASQSMLEVGQAKIQAAGLEARVRLALGLAGEDDEKGLFARTEGFDRVVFSYSLSMFDDPGAALRSAHAALAPGGRIHVVDFGQMTGWLPPVRRAAVRFLASYHVRPSPVPRATLTALATATGATLRYAEITRGYAEIIHYGPLPA